MAAHAAAAAGSGAAAPLPPLAAAARGMVHDFRATLLRSLGNDFVGGSVALAAASALLSLLWRVLALLRRTLADALFTRFDFPAGSPQSLAAARFLQSRPSVRRSSRRVVVDARAARLAATQAARGASRGAWRAPRRQMRRATRCDAPALSCH
jgi:hypothetical protein